MSWKQFLALLPAVLRHPVLMYRAFRQGYHDAKLNRTRAGSEFADPDMQATLRSYQQAKEVSP